MNKQEKLWASNFGTEYHKRNEFESRDQFWRDVLGDEVIKNAWSVLEAGAGKGENLEAIHNLRTNLFDIRMCVDRLTGVDVNGVACKEMERRGFTAINKPLLDIVFDKQFELVLTRGFLIHVPKGALAPTLAKLYHASSRYICMAEYYSPVRREVEYHGMGSALWLDDFAGELMKMYGDLTLVDYGFKYHRDNGYDLTYFLLEKK